MRGLPLRSVFSDQNINFKTQQQRPCVLLLPGHVEQSIGSFPEDPTKFKSFKKVDKAPVGATSFFAEITDGYPLQLSVCKFVLRKQSIVLSSCGLI